MKKSANKSAIQKAARALRQSLLVRAEEQVLAGGRTGEFPSPEELAYAGFLRRITRRYLDGHGLDSSDAALEAAFPFAFPPLDAETRRLLPPEEESDGFAYLCSLIPAEEWEDPAVLGWLHQLYCAGERDEALLSLRERGSLKNGQLAAATQRFTPGWLGRWMAENSLGRLGPAPEALPYFLPLEQEEAPAGVSPWEIRVLDPCVGSGKLLLCAFEALLPLYERAGIPPAEAAGEILRHNLYGLDIDPRMTALASLSLLLKAREYDPDMFRRGIRPHMEEMADSGGWARELPPELGGAAPLAGLLRAFEHAGEIGSLLLPPQTDLAAAWALCGPYCAGGGKAAASLAGLLRAAELLERRYDVVLANPPYLSGSAMSGTLSAYVKAHYPDSKYDLCTAFMERCRGLTKPGGYLAMLTQHAWMFLGSYRRLRRKLLEEELLCLAHLGPRAFEDIEGDVVQTAAFVLRRSPGAGRRGCYCRLLEGASPGEKERLFLSGKNRYMAGQDSFLAIPGAPLAYWAEPALLRAFAQGTPLGKAVLVRQGMATGGNERFLRLWFEVRREDIVFDCPGHEASAREERRWYPYHKGGGFCRWYGNQEYLIDWRHDGEAVKAFPGSVLRSPQLFFRPCATWSKVAGSSFSMKWAPPGGLFDVGGCAVFAGEDMLFYVMGLLNSVCGQRLLELLSPTLNFEVGHIAAVPLLYDAARAAEVRGLVAGNIALAKEAWNERENSWDFRRHPLMPEPGSTGPLRLQVLYDGWLARRRSREEELRRREARLNAIFSPLYGLEVPAPEAPPAPNPEQAAEDVKGFLSYAVGCLLGRYAPEGVREPRVEDGLIPLWDSGDCSRDMVSRLTAFLAAVYGEETLEENLDFLARPLGKRGTPRDILRRYFFRGFYPDHVKAFHGRPLYWLLESGKSGGFRALFYMHRYEPEQLERAYRDALPERWEACRRALAALEAAPGPVGDAGERRKKRLRRQLAELPAFQKALAETATRRIVFDVNDGVRHNYALFSAVLAKLK